IQRYGRQLTTDPDVGTGFSYHVHPIGYIPVPTGMQGLPAGWGIGVPAPDGVQAGVPPFNATRLGPKPPFPARFNAPAQVPRNFRFNQRSENMPAAPPGQRNTVQVAVAQERRGPAEAGGQLHPIAFAQQSGDSAADLTPRPEAMLPAAQADGTNAPLP